MTSKLAKTIVKQITPVLEKTIKNTKAKLVFHTYSGEYFPLYKVENKKKTPNEYQSYD